MVKVCIEKYPLGSFLKQKTPGFHMDGILKDNLDILGKRVVNDMDFILLVSGKGWVRSGKSTLVQQIGTYLTDHINKAHKTNNTFTNENVVFKGEDLIKIGLKFPKHNIIVLDEGDDLTKAHFSKDAVRLRRFFRKCGQLNHIIILVIPDFFELPRSYAVTRSICLLNVFFYGEFERGFFEFYNKNSKKTLYLKGKRWGDYDVKKADFSGRFPKLYTINEEEYKKKKFEDLYEEIEEKPETKVMMMKGCWVKVLENLNKITPKLTIGQRSQLFDMSERNIARYNREILENDG